MAVAWCGRITTGSGNVNMPPAGYKAASRFQNTLGFDLTVTKTYGRWGAGGSSTAKGKMAFYADSSGAPTTLLGVSDEKTGLNQTVFSGDGSLAGFNWSTPFVWTAGTWVWIAIISDTNVSDDQQGTATNGVFYNLNSYGAGYSNPFGTPIMANFDYVFWAEGYDGTHTLGRRSTAEGRSGSFVEGAYPKWDPHYDKFVLGGPDAPMDGASTVTVSAIWVWFNDSIATNVHCAIYDNNFSGVDPDQSSEFARTMLEGCALLGVTETINGTSGPGWKRYGFSPPIVLTAGTYWLGLCTDTTGAHCNVVPFHGHLATPGSEGGSDWFTFPAHIPVWAGPSGMTYPFLSRQTPFGISIYAEYTPGGDAIIPQIKSSLWQTPGLWID